MADIELVIKIPKIMYEGVKLHRVLDTTVDYILEAVENSTPLPKNHGRLIDVNDLEFDADWSDYYDGYTACSDSMINCAPTIVEADKESDSNENK